MSKIKGIIYRPGIYNLQTGTGTFPDQEKFLKSRWWLDLRFLQTLKTKKLNTKNSQIKHCPCPKYVMTYRPDLSNLQTRKQLRK